MSVMHRSAQMTVLLLLALVAITYRVAFITARRLALEDLPE
jgi:hypothetical protein